MYNQNYLRSTQPEIKHNRVHWMINLRLRVIRNQETPEPFAGMQFFFLCKIFLMNLQCLFVCLFLNHKSVDLHICISSVLKSMVIWSPNQMPKSKILLQKRRYPILAQKKKCSWLKILQISVQKARLRWNKRVNAEHIWSVSGPWPTDIYVIALVG